MWRLLMNRLSKSIAAVLLASLCVAAAAQAQSADSLKRAIHIANSYRTAANLTYLKQP